VNEVDFAFKSRILNAATLLMSFNLIFLFT